MARYQQAGFTIIEVVLFFAVGSALTVAILAGSGMAIASQRYKDAVATLQSDIQQQYEDVVSVQNAPRSGASELPGCSGNRGQTACVLMGKLMTIEPGGVIAQYSVYGTERSQAELDAITDEYKLIQAYNPTVVSSSKQTDTMEWDTEIAWPATGPGANTAERSIGILVIRSPRSGLVYTFTRDNAETANLVVDPSLPGALGTGKRTICVSTGGWVVGERMAVRIGERASSANAIEVRSNSLMRGLEWEQGLQC